MTNAARTRCVGVVAAAMAVAFLNGCGGDGGSGVTGDSRPVVTQPTPPPPEVVSSLSGAALEAEYMGRMVFTTARAGALEITVDWTYATNDVDAMIVTGDCSYDQLEADQCSILGVAVSETAKPEKMQIASAPAGTYTIFIGNLGPGDESISYQVVLKASLGGSARVQPLPYSRKRQLRGSVDLR
jgi:hypothetical protein